MIDHSACGLQLRSDVLGEAEMGGMIAMQVTDLVPPAVKENSPRRPGPASTPGHDVTASVIRWLGLIVWSMEAPVFARWRQSRHPTSSSELEVKP